ncbi:MAG: deoxyribonuclease V [Planctomycetota bacterium]|jgi:deoxyribonuclease V
MPVRHSWSVSIAEAQRLQVRLRDAVIETDGGGRVRLVAGADISFERGGTRLHAAVVVLDVNGLEVVEVATACAEARFPYVPGYLSFREAPPVIEAFERLRHAPDLLICDGQGRAHPRRLGLACHLGLWLDLPTIGCAKTRLIGTHREPGRRRGCHTRLLDGGEVVGEVVRTRSGVKPVFVSVGHRVSLHTARAWVLKLARYRIPEPVRAAHLEVNRRRRVSCRS